MRCIHIALLCIQENIVDRPTMATIALMLSSYSLTLSIPSKPAYFTGSGSRSLSDTRSGAHNLRATRSTESINQASITDPYPRQFFILRMVFGSFMVFAGNRNTSSRSAVAMLPLLLLLVCSVFWVQIVFVIIFFFMYKKC